MSTVCNNEPILVIMAAGMGSRYGGNKQLDVISEQGDIIMDYSLFDAHRAGFKRVAFIIKKDFEDVFKAHIEERAGKVMETYYCYQELTDIPDASRFQLIELSLGEQATRYLQQEM